MVKRPNGTKEKAGKLLFPMLLILLALVLALIFLACHALGLRQHTSSLFGMVSTPGVDDELLAGLGLVYVICHMIFFTLVPVLVLGAGLFFLLEWMMGRRRVSTGR